MDPILFKKNDIQLVVQQYTCPRYQQVHTQEFVPNISALDFLFNCGNEKGRKIFWENVQKTHEFEKLQQ